MGIVSAINSSLVWCISRVIDIFYTDAVARYIPQRTFRYLACGASNYFILDPLLYFVMYNYVVGHEVMDFGVVHVSPHILSMMIVFPVTLLSGFWLNRYVAFDATEERARVQLVRYLISIVGSLTISYILMKLLVEACGIWPTPSKVIVSALTAIYSYLAARYFTFRG